MWRTRGSATESARVNVRGLPKNRLETLVDGVFAIAMTILVLELRAPDTLGPGGLAQSLFDLRSRFAAFVISFIVLGVYWFAHHQVFHFLLRVNRTLVWLNILFLMGAGLVRFAASVMGAHTDDPIALSLYGAVLGLLAALGYLIWWYMTGNRGLIEPGLDARLVHKVRVWLAIGPVITPVAIAVSFVSTTLALSIYLALPVVFIFFNPVSRYLERLRQTEPRSIGSSDLNRLDARLPWRAGSLARCQRATDLPIPRSRARSNTSAATATSSIAIPWDLNNVMSSAFVRPGTLPATTSLISRIRSQAIRPRFIGSTRSPPSSFACSIESVATNAHRPTATSSSSRVSRRFAPMALVWHPERNQSPWMTGSGAFVAAMATSAPRMASSEDAAACTVSPRSEDIFFAKASRWDLSLPYARTRRIGRTAQTASS